MSRKVFQAIIRGSHEFVEQAEKVWQEAVDKHGEGAELKFPGTAFALPMILALTGRKVQTLADCEPVLKHCREDLLHAAPANQSWLPYLGHGLDGGAATLFAQEIVCAIDYLNGYKPQEGYHGFLTDTSMRELGIQLVDGRMPGFAAILGPAPTEEIAVDVVRELQKRSILIFPFANRDGKTLKEQLDNQKVQMGWDTYIVPTGPRTLDGIYVLNWAVRSALTFGGLKPGDFQKILQYSRDRVFAFGITFGSIPDDWYATGAASILMGYPVVSDSEDTPEVRPTGVTTYEALVRETDYEQLVPTCIEVRGVKVKVEEIDIPVAFAAAFEGERVRRGDMQVEFGGKNAHCVEFLRMVDMEEITDGEIELVGSDIDDVEVGAAIDLGIEVMVAGREMQEDFEAILERQIHRYLNHPTGVMHIGQRHLAWLRFSKTAFEKGFRIKHIGNILYAKIHDEYGKIADKVAVRLITEKDEFASLLQRAREAYRARDARLAGLTDEEVDLFYSCTLCQTFAPNHVCVVSPERPGLCGAYSWLDCKAAFQISPEGCNQPISKGRTIDAAMGEWENVNKFVYENSNRTVERYCQYSLMNHPMTSCGCFECIICIVPEANGVLVVNREYMGMTPIGMEFSTLAGQVGGGVQTPGFLGIGRRYMLSKKFISYEGGFHRIVWLPRELKDELREDLVARAEELGTPDFVDKIADETIATDGASLVEFLTKVDHPALKMESLLGVPGSRRD
ncbi:MAG: CO dehydrogenase/CO-methylating acetyl-CoA synthase complex subunit beta [Planctomycetes bacterium]|nr:CO dehydrogenase/CO-methylating acetyl-CoA synthase complex subunit beta [Planctomycetota bacterium]